MSINADELKRRRRKQYPDGVAIEPREVLQADGESSCSSEPQQRQQSSGDSLTSADLFVTMCFFARLGFLQPPTCLKCAYKTSGCGTNPKQNESTTKSTLKRKCNELVPWRIDARVPLHPDRLEGNVVFVTCDTASALVNGDAYPSIRWDVRNKCLVIAKKQT